METIDEIDVKTCYRLQKWLSKQGLTLDEMRADDEKELKARRDFAKEFMSSDRFSRTIGLLYDYQVIISPEFLAGQPRTEFWYHDWIEPVVVIYSRPTRTKSKRQKSAMFIAIALRPRKKETS